MIILKNNLVDVLGSELPISNDKGAFKYIDEVVSSGQYKQVAWQSIGSLYVPLYGLTEVYGSHSEPLPAYFPDEMEEF